MHRQRDTVQLRTASEVLAWSKLISPCGGELAGATTGGMTGGMTGGRSRPAD